MSLKRKYLQWEGFTLVELLVSMSIFVLLISLLFAMLDQTNRTWLIGERTVFTDQNGRAIMDLMANDFRPAIASKRHQFVQLRGGDLASQIPNVVPNSSALFFFSPSGQDGALAAIGYFLTADNANKRFRLNRMLLEDSDPNYPRFDSFTAQQFRDMATDAVWVKALPSEVFQIEGSTGSATSILSEGVLGFWIACRDEMGNNIPLASEAAIEKSPLFYNSAARFLMANTSPFSSGKTFHYLASSTLQAHQVPDSLVIGLALIDPNSLRRVSTVPAPSAPRVVDEAIDLSNTLRSYEQSARSYGLQHIKVFQQTTQIIN